MDEQTPAPLTSALLGGVLLKQIQPEAWYDFLAGCTGGTVGLIVGYPFDTIKVRQQTWLTVTTTAPGSTTGTTVQAAATAAFHRYAPKTLYRGMAFPLASEGLRNSLFFGLYGELLDYQARHVNSGEQEHTASVRSRDPTYAQVAVAGAIAGGIQGAVATPIELVKVVLQSNNGGTKVYQGPVDCLRKLYACHGTQGIFKGFKITVIREVPSLATYMTSYQYFQNLFKGEGRDQPTLAADLLAGGCAGVASWSINMPVDVIKSRIQSDDPLRPRYNGILDCCVKSYQEEGWRIFWRGLTITCVRAFPTNAVTLVVYSKFLRFLRGEDNIHNGSI